jgi:drug/metabolite transporter (DMT)-like permease
MHDRRPSAFRVAAATAFALAAFAANSILCRLALRSSRIDAASFTALRLLSGAAVLFALAALSRAPRAGAQRPEARAGRGWFSAAMLFAYAAAFSFAYRRLDVGAGALVLFGSVQVTMLLAGLWMGERPGALQWSGIAAALGGLVFLVRPGLSAPPLAAALLMMLAGAAWGVYSLLGRGSSSPVHETAANFERSVLFLAPFLAVTLRHVFFTPAGAALAIASGALASGLGYAAWYAALPGLSATRAATVQLCVPVLAAFAGVAFLSEQISIRLVIAAVAILGGVALALREGRRAARAPADRQPITRVNAGAPDDGSSVREE